MPKLKRYEGSDHDLLVFYCPGCKREHPYTVYHEGKSGRPAWSFNGDMERPTFTPSLRIIAPSPACHFFVTDGKIAYCGDCDHSLAGQTIDLPDLPDED